MAFLSLSHQFYCTWIAGGHEIDPLLVPAMLFM